MSEENFNQSLDEGMNDIGYKTWASQMVVLGVTKLLINKGVISMDEAVEVINKQKHLLSTTIAQVMSKETENQRIDAGKTIEAKMADSLDEYIRLLRKI